MVLSLTKNPDHSSRLHFDVLSTPGSSFVPPVRSFCHKIAHSAPQNLEMPGSAHVAASEKAKLAGTNRDQNTSGYARYRCSRGDAGCSFEHCYSPIFILASDSGLAVLHALIHRFQVGQYPGFRFFSIIICVLAST
jgi:hypothetical protein